MDRKDASKIIVSRSKDKHRKCALRLVPAEQEDVSPLMIFANNSNREGGFPERITEPETKLRHTSQRIPFFDYREETALV